MREYILDIDHLLALMVGNKILLDRLRGVKPGTARFGITVTILGELYYLVRSSGQMETNTAALIELISDLQVWEFDRGAAEITGETLTQQHALTRPISESEAQITAVARQRQAVLLTGGDHFDEVRDIAVQNWLVPMGTRG